MSVDSSANNSEMTANEIMNLLFDGKKLTVANEGTSQSIELFLGSLRAAKSRMTRQFAAVGMVLSEQDLVLRHHHSCRVDAFNTHHILKLWLEPKVKTTFRILDIEDNPESAK